MNAKEIFDAFVSTIIPAILPAIISYLIARFQGKTDIKKVTENNRAEIEKLVKQHEVDLEALKEKHKLEMEMRDKEQEHKLQLMQKEYELKIQEQQQSKANDMMTAAVGSFFGDMISHPDEAAKKLADLQKLGEQFKKSNPNGDKK